MRATLWSWREEMSYWNSLIWFRQNVHELKRLQHRYPYLELSFRRLFGDRDLDREKEKSMNSQKKFVLMPWRSLFEVSDSIFTIVKKKHNQCNRTGKRYVLFHWHDYVIHSSEVFKPNYSLFIFHLNPLFIIHYSASTPEREQVKHLFRKYSN